MRLRIKPDIDTGLLYNASIEIKHYIFPSPVCYQCVPNVSTVCPHVSKLQSVNHYTGEMVHGNIQV